MTIPSRHDAWQVSEGTNHDRQLGFLAKSVIIDNLTNSWAWVPASQRFVPPNTYAAVHRVISGTQSGQVQWQQPKGIAKPPTSNGELTMTATTDELSPSTGTPSYDPNQYTASTYGFSAALTTDPTVIATGLTWRQLVGIIGDYDLFAVPSLSSSVYLRLVGEQSGALQYIFLGAIDRSGTNATHVTFPLGLALPRPVLLSRTFPNDSSYRLEAGDGGQGGALGGALYLV